MRLWGPLEETPRWAGSRLMQAVLLLGVAVLVGGIIALYHVHLTTPGIRPYIAALLVVAACLLAAVLLRSERVRRHHREADR
jgi:Flp pilus assembly protein TadB